MRRILIYGFISIFLIACNKNKSKQYRILNYSIDTLKINTQGNSLSLTNAPNIITENNKEYYINYNEAFNTLLFFNLDSLDFEKKIQFKKSGPGKLYACENYTFTGDTLIVVDTYNIKLYHINGDFIKTLQLKDICPEIANNYCLAKSGITIANLLKIELDRKYHSIVLPTFRNGLPYEDGFYDNPLLCEYYPNSAKGRVIPIIYPDELYGKDFYDDLAIPNIISKGDSIIYHFHFKSSLYIYNRLSKKIKEIKFHSQHLPDIIQGEIRSKVNGITDLTLGPKYYNLKYDKYKDLFYLPYSVQQNKNEKYYLIAFDHNFNKIGEVNIPSGFNPKFVVSSKGLLFRNMDDLDYYYFTLYAINIDLPKKQNE